MGYRARLGELSSGNNQRTNPKWAAAKGKNNPRFSAGRSLGFFGAVWKPSGSGDPRSQTLPAGVGLGAAVWFKDQGCVNQQWGLEIQPGWGLCYALLLLPSVNSAIIQSRALPAARGAKMDRCRGHSAAAQTGQHLGTHRCCPEVPSLTPWQVTLPLSPHPTFKARLTLSAPRKALPEVTDVQDGEKKLLIRLGGCGRSACGHFPHWQLPSCSCAPASF